MTKPAQESEALFRGVRFAVLPVGHGELGVEAAWLSPGNLPLSKGARPNLVEILRWLHGRAQEIESTQLANAVYLQMAQIDRPSGPLLISRNASRWEPRIGLGVWPDREPPQPLSKEDFFNTLPTQQMRQASFHVMRIDHEDSTVANEVIQEMAGTGALLLAMVEKETWSANSRNIAAHLKSRIVAENFRGFPSYFPLLDAASLRSMSRVELQACLDGIVLYVREDPEEKAVLLISRIPLQDLFDGVFFAPQMDGDCSL